MKSYIDKQCPICKKKFNDLDDIVVCPDCGAPYHRECYNLSGECLYKDRHGTSEDYCHSCNETYQEHNLNEKTCPRCSNSNPDDAIFCNKCGFSFSDNQNSSPFNSQNIDGVPLIFDPLAGFDPKEKINNIEISDIASFIKVNTPYYLTVFKKINDKNKSRFSFSAFLFSGAWFLYRKMYKLGIFITALMFALMLASTFIEYKYSTAILSNLLKSVGISSASQIKQENYTKILEQISTLSFNEHILLYLPLIIGIVSLLIMLISGIVANKVYMRHCFKSIKIIKESTAGENEYKNKLKTSGGVNIQVVTLVLICYIIIEYLPRYFVRQK